MTVVHRLSERKRDAGAHADQRDLFDTELGCDLVGGAKADATDVAREAVWVFRDQSNRIDAIGLVDAHRARRADAVAVQKQHDLADDLLLGPARDDALCAFRADSGHLSQTARLLRDDVEYSFAKRAHELLRIDRANTSDHPRAEILLDALNHGRGRHFEKRGSELDAMGAVVNPAATRLHELAGRNHH